MNLELALALKDHNFNEQLITIKNIIAQLPYGDPFLFVDTLDRLDEEGVDGSYTFREESHFYQGHFKDHPVTPGVLLTECCAQIGLVCLGIYLAGMQGIKKASFAMSSSEMQFFLPVYPGELVRVRSQKHYFRFNKLKCGVRMYNEQQQLVCKGILAGMLITGGDE